MRIGNPYVSPRGTVIQSGKGGQTRTQTGGIWAGNQVDYLTEEHVHLLLVYIYSRSEIVRKWKVKE